MTSYSWNKTLKCQLIIIGDTGVGKTNLMMRYTHNDFSPNFLVTLGMDCKKINSEIKGRKVEVIIWDTAGQERYDSIPSSYLRDIDGVIFVYDITELSSINRINYWLNVMDKETGNKNVKKILVGNKCDLDEDRQVSKSDGEKMAKDNNQMFFYETSAKNNTNIDDAFLYIINEIVETKMDEEVLPENVENTLQLESTNPNRKSCQC